MTCAHGLKTPPLKYCFLQAHSLNSFLESGSGVPEYLGSLQELFWLCADAIQPFFPHSYICFVMKSEILLQQLKQILSC